MFSGRGLYDELITPSEQSYQLWCVNVCDLGTSRMRRPGPPLGCSARRKHFFCSCFSLTWQETLLSPNAKN